MVLSPSTMAQPSYVEHFSFTQRPPWGKQGKPREVLGWANWEQRWYEQPTDLKYTEPVIEFSCLQGLDLTVPILP